MTTSQLDLLWGYMNYEVRGSPDTGYTVLVHDHRAVVPAIWAARQDGLFTVPPLLLRMDAHDDYANEQIEYATERNKLQTLEDCLLAANRLKSDDGGWVDAVVQWGWVKDVVTFFVKKSTLPGRATTVTDLDHQPHRLFSLDTFEGCFGSQGVLSDIVRQKEHADLHDALGWSAKDGWTRLKDPEFQIWVDIDLDFAVHSLGDFGKMPWRWTDFQNQFLKPIVDKFRDYGYQPPAALLANAMQKAKLITIATEPTYSCGFEGVATILECLDRCLEQYGNWFAWND